MHLQLRASPWTPAASAPAAARKTRSAPASAASAAARKTRSAAAETPETGSAAEAL